MASLFTRATVAFRDNAGAIAKIAFLVAIAAIDPSTGAVDAIRAAVIDAIKAISQRAETGGETAVTGSTATASDYCTIEDRLIATFAGNDGSTTLFEVPGPIDAAFLTDGVTLDPTNTAVAAWITYVQDNFKTLYGGSLQFVKGIRSSKKQMKI